MNDKIKDLEQIILKMEIKISKMKIELNDLLITKKINKFKSKFA